MKKMKLVMVGNGMAGVRTLEELRKIAPDLYDITVFGAEPYANYNRILLSPVLAGEQTIQDIMLNDVDWYVENDIKLHLGKKIVKIDRVKRLVLADPDRARRGLRCARDAWGPVGHVAVIGKIGKDKVEGSLKAETLFVINTAHVPPALI